jgi:hypothetical protein
MDVILIYRYGLIHYLQSTTVHLLLFFITAATFTGLDYIYE